VGAYVRLEILPKNIAIFSSYIGGLQALPPVLDVLREFHISHAIPARSISIWNGVKFLARNSIRSSYSDEVIREAEAESWFLTGFLAAETEHILSERKDHVCAGLKTVTDNVSGQIIRIDNGWKEGFDRFLGKPSPINLRTAYWSCDKVPEYCLMDPDRDNCGLLWLCLAFPFDGNVVTEFVQRAVDLMRPYRIDFNIGMEAASHRCLLAYINLSYARVGEASDAEALACYQDILSLSTEMGLAPYRLANGLAKKATQTETELDRYLSALKRVGDPHSIFSRGRNGIN
jgi:4-cresol dehydrogenase (hydroxylating)